MQDLVRRAQMGDKEAFVLLMQEHKLALFKAAKAILHKDEDVADAIQDTVLAAFKYIPRLKSTKYFKTWLTRILINKCYDIRKKNMMYISAEAMPEIAETDSRIEEISENVLAELGQNYRLVLNLHYAMGFTVKEIAKLLKLNENTVKTRLSRGREAAKKAYVKEMEVSAL